MNDAELKLYRADLHIHTCLSPCGDWDMSPAFVIGRCVEKKIDIVAITDHNTIENTKVAMALGKEAGVTVLPSMEICSAEEVHILALFDSFRNAEKMQAIVYDHLKGDNQPEVFGYQVVANENDEVVSQNEKLLIGAIDLSINKIVEAVHLLEGIAIAAHIDKKAFSLLGQLGFVPPDLDLDAVEVSYRERPERAVEKFLFGMDIPCITSSDAHFPGEIGRVSTKFIISKPSVIEMKMALQGVGGRRIIHSGEGV